MVKVITFKLGADEEAETVCAMLDAQNKVCSTQLDAEGRQQIVAYFEDELDYLAFLVAIGGAKIVSVGVKDSI